MKYFSSIVRPAGAGQWRRLKSWLLPVLLTLGAAPAAQAQCSFTVSTTPAGPLSLCSGGSTTLTAAALTSAFNAGGGGFIGAVTAVVVQPDGKVLVGGDFNIFNGAVVSRGLVRLNADGSRDLSFNGSGAGFDNSVTALALEPDGQVLVGGFFQNYNGTAVPHRLMRLNADGSRDTGFNGSNVGFDNTVLALALEPDGQVLAGGSFSTYNGATVPHGLVRVNADGSLDTGFNGTSDGFIGNVLALALEPDGQVLAGGSFAFYNGVSCPNGLVRLNANGSRDATFNSTGSGFGAIVQALALEPDGQVLVGGNFSTYNGATVPSRLVRLNADGTRDASFNGTSGGFDGVVEALSLEPDGQVLVGGNFMTYNGVDCPDFLVRLNTDGTRDTGFNGTSSGLNGTVYDLALEPGGQVLVGGNFSTYNGATVPRSLTRLTAAGSLSNAGTPVSGATYAWSNGATGASITVSQPGTYLASATSGGCTSYSNAVTVNAAPAMTVSVTPAGPIALTSGGSQLLTATANTAGFNVAGSGFNGNVFAVLALPDGKALVGGAFSTYNGANVPVGLVRLNADGSRDASFNGSGSGFNNNVRTLALEPDGQVLVGGDFTQYNGTNVPARLVRLNPDGSRDATFNGSNSGFDGNYVHALAVEADGQVLVGGNFTHYNGADVPDGLVRLNADGSHDASFNGTTGGFNNLVYALALEADGQVLVGGLFSTYNGMDVPDFLVRLNADGSRDATFNSNNSGFNNSVLTLAVETDGQVLAGGPFTSYNGVGVPNRLVRLNSDGSRDVSFANGSGFDATVTAVALEPDGQVLVGGGFTTFNGVNVPNGLVRFNADGSRDTGFNGSGFGFGGAVYALAVEADGQVLAGGTSSVYNGTDVPDYLTRLNADGSLNDAATPVPNATYAWSPGGSTGNTLSVNTAGSYTATATDPATGCSYTSNTVVVTAAPGDLIVSTTAGIPAGTYNNVTVTGTGFGTLQGNVTVNGALLVQTGGQLGSGCFTVAGGGTFTVQAGATLAICSPQGLSTTAGTGSVQTTGVRSLSTDATYLYNGSAAQVTGNGLPATVRELALSNAAGLTLTQPVQVSQRVNLLSGNLNLNSQPLTLLSSAAGTALVNNTGGTVLGLSGTMQRHIETNPGANGYRHYSSPVQAETLATLATNGYTPNFSGAVAYNTSPTPGTVTPFPTVFVYEQNRIATTVSTFSAFDKGWLAPTSAAVPMEVGRGYSVNAPGTALVDFTGTFTNGSVTRSSLSRTGTEGGWHLLGNPYPSPLDWSTLTQGAGQSLENMDAAMYVFQSSGPYSGSYRAYANGIGASPLIPAGAGYFVRTSTAGTPGTVRLSNANRETAFGPQPAFGRGTTDTRPQVSLTLSNGTQADEATIYAEAGASNGLDAAYDATKLANPSGLNLAMVAASGEVLAIDGRPAFTTAIVVPLRLEVATAGRYTLAATLANLPANLTTYLRDAATGQQVNLSQQPSYALQLTAGLSTRYSLVFAPAAPLANAAALTAAQVVLYPNPAHQSAGVSVACPAAAGSEARATVLNALGQVVATAVLPVRAGQARGTLPTAGLAAGVYTVRLHTDAGTISKRLVVE
jgi:uncharacterized delta-60 repeat protein